MATLYRSSTFGSAPLGLLQKVFKSKLEIGRYYYSQWNLQHKKEQRLNLLLVEDNSETLTATAMLLEHLGCEVHKAKDAFEAIELLETEKPMDIMFSDISLPHGMNGLQLARAVRNVWPDIGIILGTGFDIASVKEMPGYETDYRILQKPYDLAHLRSFLGSKIPA